jgi:uncharacterized protein (TIGR02271 family)
MSTNYDDYVTLTNGMEVFDAGGEKVGKIVDVTDEAILVEKGFFFVKDYLIPISVIEGVTDDNDVYLTLPKDRLTEDLMSETSTADLELAGSTTFDPTIAAGAGITPDQSTANTQPSATGEVIAPDYTAESDAAAAPDADATRVPVYEEQVTPIKRSVSRGAVRIKKELVTANRTVTVPVTEERVRVTRVETDEPIAAGTEILGDDVIDIPVQGEAVDLESSIRQTGEVIVEKETVRRDEQIDGTVRREEVTVDDETVTTGTDRSVRRNEI